MNPRIYQDVYNLIDRSHRILLLTHARADCDGLGAALSAYSVLKQMGKEPTVATSDPIGESMQFLPSVEILQNSLGGDQFVITLDISNTAINKIKYNASEDQKTMNIVVTPKNGVFTEKDVSFSTGQADEYDLIMIFDTGNLEHLGALYENNVDLFYNTPVINIDHHASNTNFGQVNVLDPTAASATEVFYELLKDLQKRDQKTYIDEDIATLLLAGLITDTGSFQHSNTSPRSMETAAELLDLGARQQEIIKNIYKTKKLSTLKLWGSILSKVQVDPVYRMVWSTISEQDLKDAGATSDENEGIIDDLLTNAPGAEVVFLIKYNEQGYVSTSMRSTGNQIDVGEFCAQNGGGGHVRAAGFKVHDKKPFESIVGDIVEKVRQFQAKRLNIDPDQVNHVANPMMDQPTPTVAPANEQPVDSNQPKEVTYLNFDAPEPVVDRSAPADVDRVEGQSANADESQVVDSSNEDKPKTKSQKRREQRKRAKERKEQEQAQTEQPAVTPQPEVTDQEKNVQELSKAFVSQPTEEAAQQSNDSIKPVIEPVVVPEIEIQQPAPQTPNVQPIQVVDHVVDQPAKADVDPVVEQPLHESRDEGAESQAAGVESQPEATAPERPMGGIDMPNPEEPQTPEMPDWLKPE